MSKRGLVLVGGGGLGRWEAAVACALVDAGLKFDLIVGTSVGGMNACVLGMGIAQGKGGQSLKDAWARISKDEDVYSPSLTETVAHPALHPVNCAVMAHEFIHGAGACKTDALEALVKDVCGDWSTTAIEKAGGPEVMVRALSYGAGRGETLQGLLWMMALATSAIEGIFPKRFGFGDGGAVDNEPVDIALDKGCDQIVVIYCTPEKTEATERPSIILDAAFPQVPSTSGLQNAMAVLAGITSANEDLVDQAATAAEANGVKVVHICPDKDNGSALDFTERGMWADGEAKAASFIAQFKQIGWIA